LACNLVYGVSDQREETGRCGIMSFEINVPVFVNTEFNYFCEGCKMCELIAETNCLYETDGIFEKYHTLSCKHYKTCKTLMHNLRNAQMKGNKNEKQI
jgi:hypothetical protein